MGIAGCLWSRSEEGLVVGHISFAQKPRLTCEEGFSCGSIQSGEEWSQWALRPVEAQTQSHDPGSVLKKNVTSHSSRLIHAEGYLKIVGYGFLLMAPKQ